MATTFDDDERSASQSRPIDLYTITTPTATYRLTSHILDVAFNGFTYTATTMSRSNLNVAQDLTGRELVVYLPITHALVQRFVSAGIPEREVLITFHRLQEKSVQVMQLWSGFATGLSIDGHTALLRVPSVLDDAMRIRLPVVVAQRLCNHILFDAQCSPVETGDGPQRVNFQVVTSIVSQTGVTMVVGSMGGQPDQWAAFGEVVHTSTGERRNVLIQVGATLTLNVPFSNVLPGDGVTVFAGCAHNISVCGSKFTNAGNFGGHPYMSTTIDPWKTKGIGVIRQP